MNADEIAVWLFFAIPTGAYVIFCLVDFILFETKSDGNGYWYRRRGTGDDAWRWSGWIGGRSKVDVSLEEWQEWQRQKEHPPSSGSTIKSR